MVGKHCCCRVVVVDAAIVMKMQAMHDGRVEAIQQSQQEQFPSDRLHLHSGKQVENVEDVVEFDGVMMGDVFVDAKSPAEAPRWEVFVYHKLIQEQDGREEVQHQGVRMLRSSL